MFSFQALAQLDEDTVAQAPVVTVPDFAASDGPAAAEATSDDENVNMYNIFGGPTADSHSEGPDSRPATSTINVGEVDWSGLLEFMSKAKQTDTDEPNVLAGWTVTDCGGGTARFALNPDLAAGHSARVLTVKPQGEGSSFINLYGRAQRPIPIDPETQSEIQHVCDNFAVFIDTQYQPVLAPHDATIRQSQVMVPHQYAKIVVMLLLGRLAEGQDCKCIDCEHSGPQKGE